MLAHVHRPSGGGELITVLRYKGGEDEIILNDVSCEIRKQDTPPPDYKAWLKKPDKEILKGDIVKRDDAMAAIEIAKNTEGNVATRGGTSQLLVTGVNKMNFSPKFRVNRLHTRLDFTGLDVHEDDESDVFIVLDLKKYDSNDPNDLWERMLYLRRLVVSELERYYRDKDGRKHKVTTRIYEEWIESYEDWVIRKMEVFFDVIDGVPSETYHYECVVDPHWELVDENWTKHRISPEESVKASNRHRGHIRITQEKDEEEKIKSKPETD